MWSNWYTKYGQYDCPDEIDSFWKWMMTSKISPTNGYYRYDFLDFSTLDEAKYSKIIFNFGTEYVDDFRFFNQYAPNNSIVYLNFPPSAHDNALIFSSSETNIPNKLELYVNKKTDNANDQLTVRDYVSSKIVINVDEICGYREDNNHPNIILAKYLYRSCDIIININNIQVDRIYPGSTVPLIGLYSSDNTDNSDVICNLVINANNCENDDIDFICNNNYSVIAYSSYSSNKVYSPIKQLNVWYNVKHNNAGTVKIKFDNKYTHEAAFSDTLAKESHFYFDLSLNIYNFTFILDPAINNITVHLLNVPASIVGNYTNPCFVIENQIGLTVGNIIANKYLMTGSSEK